MTDLERYLSFKKVLERPMFNSIEQAESEMRAASGEFRQFIIRKRPGSYTVCACYIQTDREGNAKWAHREEYSFLHSDMLRMRDRAALAVGRELVESM
jgi:hypothetical protein